MGEAVEDDNVAGNSCAGARVHPPLTAVNDRVEYISQLMADDVYTPETSRVLRKELCTAWGVAGATIMGYASEAHRTRLDEVRERRAEVARIAVNALIEVAEGADLRPGDRAAKVAASKTLLEFAGVDKPDEDKIQKHMIAGIAEATPARAREVMLGLFGTVTPDEAAMADADHKAGQGKGSGGVPGSTPG